MTLSRVATISQTNRLIEDNMRLQSKLANTQIQMSTGLKTTDYKDIASDTQRLLSLERVKEQLDGYSVNGKIILNQVNLAYDVLESMDDGLNTMLQGLVATNSGNFVPVNVTTNIATNGLNEFVSLLNTRIGDRYIFSGTDIDTRPVDITDPLWPAQAPPSVADFDYYQGNTTTAPVQLSETLTVNYSLLANDPAFEKALRAFNLVINNPGNAVAYTEATDLIHQSLREISSLRGSMSSVAKTIEDQNVRNDEDIVNLDVIISDIKEVDLAAASVDLQNYQTQLEASYSASIRLLRLSLTNFL